MDLAAILLHLVGRLRDHTRPAFQPGATGTRARRIARAFANILELATSIIERLALPLGPATPRPATQAAIRAVIDTVEQQQNVERLEGVVRPESFRLRKQPLHVLVARLLKQVAIITPLLDADAQAEIQALCNQLTLAAPEAEPEPLPAAPLANVPVSAGVTSPTFRTPVLRPPTPHPPPQ